MAKKNHPQMETVNTKKNTSFSLGFFEGPSTFNRDQFNGLNYISDLSGTSMIEDLLSQESDYYILSFNSEHFKHSTFVKTMQKWSTFNLPKVSHYVVCSLYKPAALWKQILLGDQSHRQEASFVILDRKTLELFSEQKSIPKNRKELVWIAAKTCSKELFISTEDSSFAKSTFLGNVKQKGSQYLNFITGSVANPWKLTFLLLCIASFIGITQLSKSAGISGDEFTQYEYSKLTANYYLDKIGESIPIDTNTLKAQKMVTLAKQYGNEGINTATLEDPEKVMHLYGSSFDTFTTILAHFVNADDYMSFRHWWNAVFGFFIFVFGALTIRRITNGSWFWACVGLILLFLTPRLLGESLNNPKDVPFALGYIMSIYYAIKVFSNFPNAKASDLVGLVLGTALGISIRIGGLLSIAIFFMYAGLKYIQNTGLPAFLKLKWTHFEKWIIGVMILSLLSYIVGIYFWPYGWDQPFSNPLKALKAFTNYAGSIRQLFEGKMYDSDSLPSHYLIKYVGITLPVTSLIGGILFLILSIVKRNTFTLEEFLVFFGALFPIFYIFINHSQVYGGLRQILFTIPLFVAMGVSGWYKLQQMFPKLKFPVAGVLALLIGLLPAKFILANPSLSYIYFNETVGGTKGAYGKYEMDYYLAGLRSSTEWFLTNVARKQPNKKFEVLTYGMDQVRYYCRNDKNVHVGFTRFDDRGSKKWDYCIFYNAYFDAARLKSGEFPPKGTVFSPMVDGVPIGCVIERLSMDNYEGIKIIESGPNYRDGINKLLNYVTLDPTSSESYFYISTGFANLGNLDSAILYAKKSLEYFPEYSRSLFALQQYYMNKKDYDNAAKIMDEYIESRPNDSEGYIMKAQALLMKREFATVLETLNRPIELNPLDSRSYMLGAQCYQQQKDEINFKQWYQAAMLNQAKTQADQSACIESIGIIYEGVTGKEFKLEDFMK